VRKLLAVNISTKIAMQPHITALRCLFLLGKHHGIIVPKEKLAAVDKENAIGSLLLLMRDVGLTGKLVTKAKWRHFGNMRGAFPVMVEYESGHWVILVNVALNTEEGDFVAILDPTNEAAGVTFVPRATFEAQWTRRMILCRRHWRTADAKQQPFGLMWFMPEILRNGRSFRDVALLSMMSNVIGLGTPLLFNIMIDKVVPHRSYNTLIAVILAFFLAMIFEAIFSYVRSYLTMYAGNKIDARLASRSFAHVLRLPMDFFEKQTVGVLLRNIQQTEGLRNFLTGRLFFTLLEVFTLPILLVCLVLYSPLLTGIVLFFSLLIASVIGIMVPIFKKQLEKLYEAEGDRIGDLVETLHGMRAVKSLALEELRQESWDRKVANSIRRRASVGHFGIVAGTITNALSTMLTFSLLGVGVTLVFNGNLSLGGLIAFNMLSGRVTGPLLQIVGLVNEYQQIALSVKMLGTIMDHPPERDPSAKGITPPITGAIEFQNVSFQYDGAASLALDNVSFKVEEGQFIGVVGRSGSGKTTLTRLIQGLHEPKQGLIQLNGTDIRHLDLVHLRRSIGVVLQDSVLFRGSIKENIAAANPEAGLEEVMECARLAGADEFISRLPRSYEQRVEESATNFSGGQRQRIAIARALLLKPRLLLFDEATSALDPESEAIIQDNLQEIAKGRTMIVVSHRLSSLANADAILVMDRGKVMDFAPHKVLLERCEIYRHLWDQQTRFVQ
jgi:subfamily B ATP-binding cassette protein HlyB/CyaB